MLTRADVLAIGQRIEATFPPGLTDRHRGYTSFGAGTRLFAKLRRLDTDAEFAHLIRSFERIGLAPDVDQSLILAIAFRESGPLVLGSRTRLVDTFHQGGLDRLYREAPRLERQGFLPPRVRRALRPGSTSATEGTTPRRTRRAAAALIPQRDLIVAYGAVIRDRYHRFVHRAAAAGLSTDDLDTRARRIWTALFFGGPNGLAYDNFARLRDTHARDRGWMGSNFGAKTIITFLVGAGLTARDITHLDEHEPRLYDTDRVLSAFIVTAEAEVLDWLKVLSRSQ